MTNLSTQPTSHADEGEGALARAHLSFVGCGAMAEAMIAGLLRRRLVAPAQITGSHPRAARRDELAERYRIEMVESNLDAATASGDAPGGSIVVLAVKPQRLGGVLEELAGALGGRQVALSIIAGASLETLAEGLRHTSVVRAMPNTPAQIGEGMTAWTPTPEVGEEQLAQVCALLGALGREMRVDTERMIDMATALSATGPTYIFMMMEALVDAGVHMGFSRHVAQELVT
ncbi:MAG TPA: pyrroline-5-carboxylate reductase dimerization domain-containing protein, partial [Pyrinomonadaceae bacterium]|nr:pyrroline-5-carboxylate reductase dimerization domain-containing protein [Pyrinomonadaceae bacterium]